MHIYEYLFTAIIIVLILLSSSTMISTISEPSHSTSEKEQLKVTAQKIMTQILLDPGNPSEWGSYVDINENNLTTFGLAKYSETTREAYVLDPSKVLRLDSAIPSQFYISPSRVIDLLNLGYDYGFALEFYPALIVDYNATTNEVSVNSQQDGLPIWLANVYARMYYYNETSGQIESTFQINTITGVNGTCIVDFGIHPEKKILILVVDYYGVRVMKVVDPSGSNVMRAYLLGNRLYGASNISDNAIEIMVHRKAGRYAIENVTYSTSKENIEPTTVAILALSDDSNQMIFAPRLPVSDASEEARLTYSSIQGVELSFPFAYSVERSVIICGSAYIVRLYLWRMSF